MAEHRGIAQPVELLSVGAATADDGRTVVVLTIRPDQGSWRPHNLSLTAEHFERLRRDLNDLAEESELLAGALPRVRAKLDRQEAAL